MARHKLTATGLKAAAPGTYLDGAGLMLLRTASGGSWVWRFQREGRRRDMGLGSYPDLSLAEARKARDRWAEVMARGLDPITERERQRAAERTEAARLDPTLGEAVARVYELVAPALRDGGERTRWMSPLANTILPKLGDRRLGGITPQELRDAFRPSWRSRAPTAAKAMMRLAIVYRRGRRLGFPCDPEVVAIARDMLGPQLHEAGHIEATPWPEVPALYARLDTGGTVHQALRLLILTAARVLPVRGMRFSEVEGDVWTVPADRMKGRRGTAQPFRIPLSPPALQIVRTAREATNGDVVFQGARAGTVSEEGLRMAMNTLGEPGRPHGFRTSFRSWVQDTGACSWDVAETALAHSIGGTVERSYARSDLLDQRRVVMARWGAFVTGGTEGPTGSAPFV